LAVSFKSHRAVTVESVVGEDAIAADIMINIVTGQFVPFAEILKTQVDEGGE
jgi:hypothetical protein